MRAADLLSHFKHTIDTSIANDVDQWGPGTATHARYCAIFQPIGMTGDEWLAVPFYLYRPGEVAWERRAAACMAEQKRVTESFGPSLPAEDAKEKQGISGRSVKRS